MSALNDIGARWLELWGPALIQDTAFLAIVLLALLYLRGTPARVRYGIGLFGLAKLLLPPFVPHSTPLPAYTHLPPVRPLFEPLPSTLELAPVSDAVPATAALTPIGLLFALWVLIAAWLLLRPLVATLRLAVVLRGAQRVTEPEALACETRTGIATYRCERIGVPLTLFLFPHRIFVPRSWDAWSSACRDSVLEHEAAHLHRHDGAAMAVQLIVRALYFFHPLVWLLDRRLDELREMACDDACTRHDEQRSLRYSHHLLEIAERARFGLIACASSAALLRRRNELLRRVAYQMETVTMNSRAKVRITVSIVLLALLVIPLSLRYEEAAADLSTSTRPGSSPVVTGDTEAGGGAAPNQSSHRSVSLVIQGDGSYEIDSDSIDNAELAGRLDALARWRSIVVVHITCKDGVGMGALHEVHRLLTERNLNRVSYEQPGGDGLPLMLPTPKLQQRIAEVSAEDIATVHVSTKGAIDLGGAPIAMERLAPSLTKRLIDNDNLIVAIQTRTKTPYRSFVGVLDAVKRAGAQRVIVPPPRPE